VGLVIDLYPFVVKFYIDTEFDSTPTVSLTEPDGEKHDDK